MANVINRLKAQETGEPPPSAPDIDRPPDQELPDVGADMPEIPDGPGAPPFTGEDVEDPESGDLPTMESSSFSHADLNIQRNDPGHRDVTACKVTGADQQPKARTAFVARRNGRAHYKSEGFRPERIDRPTDDFSCLCLLKVCSPCES
jgi:hypothetical protein